MLVVVRDGQVRERVTSFARDMKQYVLRRDVGDQIVWLVNLGQL